MQFVPGYGQLLVGLVGGYLLEYGLYLLFDLA